MSEDKVQELETAEQSDNSPDKTEDEGRIVVKDDEVYLKVDESDQVAEGTETEPEQGEPGEVIQESAEQEESLDPMYTGKNINDVIEMHQNASKKISEQGDELGQLRQMVKPDEMSPEQIFANLSAAQLENGLETEKAKLAGMDPTYDEDEYIQQKHLVDSVEKDWIRKLQQEAIDSKFNEIDNGVFIGEQKQSFKDLGIDISDDEFDAVKENAKNYAESGKLTERALHKSLIDKYGVGMVSKYFSMSGEKKAREEITNAKGKVVTKVDVKGSGKNAKLVNVKNLSRGEMNRLFNDPNMSSKELQRLYDSLNK